jgi:hypothetical protein
LNGTEWKKDPETVFPTQIGSGRPPVLRIQAIGASAQALLELQAKQPNAVEAFELFIATDHRLRAGQFLIAKERAQELVSKQLDLTAFYLKYVEF